MIPLQAIRELVDAHEGSRVDLLRRFAARSNVRFLKRLLESAEARKTVESMDTSAFLRLIAAVIEKSLGRSPRKRLKDVSSVEKAASLLKTAKNVLVLTGAGISTSCGIPDFRSASGVYSMLGEYDLSDPQDLFAISYFRRNTKPFFHFARKLWPGTHKPAVTHKFIKMIESYGGLLRNYTQNIDTLERVVGVERIVQCHGSFSSATCTRCKFQCDGEAIKADVMAGRPPLCPRCVKDPQPSLSSDPFCGLNFGMVTESADALPQVDPSFDEGCMKPDIIFFGEKLPDRFFNTIESDVKHCDLVLVMGTSLKVAPVSRIVEMVEDKVPQILINREVVGQPHEFDVELLGNCDVVCAALAKQIGWSLESDDGEVNMSFSKSEKSQKENRYMFQGGVETESDCELSDSGSLSDDDSKDNSTSPDCEYEGSAENTSLVDNDETEHNPVSKRKVEHTLECPRYVQHASEPGAEDANKKPRIIEST